MSMAQVAKSVGVSVATVSRVVNGYPHVSNEVAQKVRVAIEELGYRSARGRRRNGGRPRPQTGYVGFLWVNVSRDLARLPTMVDLVTGAGEALAQCGYQLVLTQVPDPAVLPHEVNPRRMDGALVVGHPAAAMHRALEKLGTVSVLGGSRALQETDWADLVAADYGAIGHLAATYFLDRGHRRLAYLNVQPHHAGLEEVGRAYELTAGQADATTLLVTEGPDQMPVWDPLLGRMAVRQFVQQILAQPEKIRPTGLLVTDNVVARFLYQALEKHGLMAGRHFEVVTRDNETSGLDDLEPRPALIRVDHQELGRRAVDKLMYRIKNPGAQIGARLLLPPSLEQVSIRRVNGEW